MEEAEAFQPARFRLRDLHLTSSPSFHLHTESLLLKVVWRKAVGGRR
jgi:hypothetical protein